ncbi:hypothetical protein U1Q18_050355 [Sarracenia purpurea var. burkii]
MFRLFPTRKGWNFPQYFLSRGTHYQLFSTTVNCARILSNGTDKTSKEIDFEFLFQSCTKPHLPKRLHGLLIVSGKAQSIFIATRLVNLYANLGNVTSSRHTFDHIPNKDAYTWNSMVSAYVRNSQFHEAVSCLYELLLNAEIRPDFYTFPPVLKACDNLLDGKKIHCWVFKLGFEWDVFVAASLVHMYCRFGSLAIAHKIFNDMPFRDRGSWNAMISGFCQNGSADAALSVLDEMRLEGMKMDCITVSTILPACAQMDDISRGMLIHLYVIKHGLEFDVFVSNALINMYAKFGNLGHAQKVFDQMFVRDLVSWNSIIAAYEQNGNPDTALMFYVEMMSNGIQPDVLTLVSLASSVAQSKDCQSGRSVHGFILRRCWIMEDVVVGNAAVDMMSSVPWNAIISCHGLHGHGGTSMQLFGAMLDEGVKPDHVTFVSLLSACSHSGLVDQGEWCFHLMQEEYGIEPSLKHYGCMVDLLGRAGYLEKAYSFIKDMPLRPDASIWGALLGACRIHGNVELAKFASDRLFEVDSENVGYYVLLSNIYANVGKWEGADEVRSLARDRGLKKTPGWSSIELENRIEIFYTGNQSHPHCEEIYKELEILTDKMKSLGYIPDYSFVLQDVEDDEKEYILMSHSERLAIAYGIISTPPRSPIQIFKNLRVCGDCHNVTKFISKITEREIIVRDSNRFHHFKDGICSCGDYW